MSGVLAWLACGDVADNVFVFGFVLRRFVSLVSGFHRLILVWTCSARYRSLLNFLFSVARLPLVRLLGSSLDSVFWFPVSDSGLDLLRALLNFRFLVLGFWLDINSDLLILDSDRTFA